MNTSLIRLRAALSGAIAIGSLVIVSNGSIVSVSRAQPVVDADAHSESRSVGADTEVTLDGTYPYNGAITLADLDGDDQEEIIFGGRALNSDGTLACNGKVYVYRANGTLKWEATVRAGVNSSPAVADLNGDGVKDVVAGMGAWHDPEVKPEGRDTECGVGDPNAPGNGGLVALDGKNGNTLWVFNTQDWGEWGAGANGEMPNGVLDGVYSSPAIGDVDHDGDLEIAFGSWDNCIYLLDTQGNPLWGEKPFDTPMDFCGRHGFFANDTVYSSPALVDLTGDGSLEIVSGGDVSCDDPNDPDKCNLYMVPNGGFLWVIRKDGTPLARRWMDQAIYSSPAVADVDNDGVKDIIVGTGQGFPGTGYYVTAWNLDVSRPVSDALVQKWKTDVVGRTFSSPALGDLNNDGVLDVVTIIKYGDWGTPVGPAPDNGSYVYALRGDSGAVLWQTHACNNDSTGRSFPIDTSPVLADVAGDSRPEVLFPHAWEIAVLNPDGTYYSRVNTSNGCTSTSGSVVYSGNGTFSAPVAVGDLQGDGSVDIVAAGRWNEGSGSLKGALYIWPTTASGNLPWPMFHRDEMHTGLFLPSTLAVDPDEVGFLMEPADLDVDSRQVWVSNMGSGGSIRWETVYSLQTSWLQVSPATGTTTANPYLTVTVNKSSLQQGRYLASFDVQSLDSGVGNSPHTVNVTLYVGRVSHVFLPLTKKD